MQPQLFRILLQVEPEAAVGGDALLTTSLKPQTSCREDGSVHACVCMCSREENERQTAAKLDSNSGLDGVGEKL